MPLPEPIPDLHALDLLVSVGERGSIRAAAQAHGITQPAASMRMRSLERVLGLSLLERSPTGSRLTPAGQAATEWAGAVLQTVRTLQAGAAALRDDKASHLKIAASLTVAEYLLPRWLQLLSADHTEVAVSLEMGNTAHVGALVDGGAVALGFIEGARPPGRLRSREICADELVVVVARRHPWARRRRPITAGELAASPLILRERGSGTREVLDRALDARGMAVRASMEMGSTTAIKAAVAAGGSPGVLSALAVATERRQGSLVVVPCHDMELGRVIRAIWRSDQPLTGAAQRLVHVATTAP